MNPRVLLIPLLLVLLASAPPRASQVARTGPPRLLVKDYGYLTLRPEAEFRQLMKRSEGDEGAVPLAQGPTGLSPAALYDSTMVLGQEVSLAVEGDAQRGYSLMVDLNANGQLSDDRRWPMHTRSVELWDLEKDAWERKQARVAEIDTSVSQAIGGRKVSIPVRIRVALTEDMVRLPGRAEPIRQAVLAQATLREGTVESRGKVIRFAVSGEGGIYGDDFNSVMFDLNGDGKLDEGNRESQEYFWVWEREVNLNGESFEFSVDRYGRTLMLTPLDREVRQHPSLEAGHEAPDFAFTDLEGQSHRLSDYRGKVVLLDFWGTWCPACVAHARTLAEAYARLHDKGFEILGIHGGGTEEQVRKFTAEHGMIWPQALDSGKEPGDRPLQKLYRFLGAPNYLLVGSDGKILVSGFVEPAKVISRAEQQVGSSQR